MTLENDGFSVYIYNVYKARIGNRTVKHQLHDTPVTEHKILEYHLH